MTMIVGNMDDLTHRLRDDLFENGVLNSDVYKRIWIEWVLKNKKKQQYGFVVTLFPSDGSLYTQKFLDRVPINFSLSEDEGRYIVNNYDKVFEQFGDLLKDKDA